MSSYYNRISGTLEPTKIARVSDIHLIQSSIEDAFSRLIVDMFGPAFILGHEKDTLTLIPTPLHIDQSNTTVDDTNQWISCYSRYFRQGIDTKKSEIDTITIHMLNLSNISVNVFAEIRDINFNLIKEANAVLPPTIDGSYQEVIFDFNEKHLPIGHYYFVLRPIDLSSIDLSINGDETEYDTIEDWMFQVKYDVNGNYKGALEASYNGHDYLESRLLADQYDNNKLSDYKADLYFEQCFSKGNTYLITPGAAIIRGQKTYPVDTHVTIDGPSSLGDRIDLITLTADGKLNVIQGTVYNGEKIYPVSDAGLKIAYITTYKSSVSQWACTNCGHINEGNTDTCPKCGEVTNEKIPLIEQSDEVWNDENHYVTRERSLLERMRRVEKKINYTMDRNAPSRIKYICTVDPIINNNGSETDKEGTYGMSVTTNGAGETVYIPKTGYDVQQMYWSIREQAGEKVTTVTTEIKGILTGYNLTKVYEGPEQFKVFLKDPDTGNALASKKIAITINGVTYTRTTDVQGYAYLNINLLPGTYTTQSSYGDATVTNTVTVLDKDATVTPDTSSNTAMTIGTRVSQTSSVTEGTIIPNYVITGDDSFYKDGVTVDTKEGKISLQKTEYANDTYSSNTPLSKSKQFSAQEIGYTIRDTKDRIHQNSEYAVLNLTIPHDCDVKSITPHITRFQNIDTFKIVLFKNDEVFNLMKTPGLCYQKRYKDDSTFPNIYESNEYSLKEAATTKSNTISLSKPVTFTPDEPLHLTAGSYSLWVKGTLTEGQKEGTIFITEYETLSETDTYGVSTKCLGTAQGEIIYLETNNISNRSWDVILEKKNHVYFERGTVMSQGISTRNRIYSCSVSKNINIPEGCSISTYVSNNGGRTWVNASNGAITFSGTGNTFKWKLILNGTGDTTPEVYFNNDKGYALLFNVGTAEDYVDYEDYKRCFETQLLDGNQLTNFLLSANTTKRFSEWEFVRIWMEDYDKASKIDICISYNEDNPLLHVGQPKQYWPSQTFFSTVFADLTLSDFQQTSVDYDNYNGMVEFDENNYRFDINEDYQYNYNNGVVISQGKDAGDINIEHIDNTFKYNLVDTQYTYEYTGETSAYVNIQKDSNTYNVLFKTQQLNKVYNTSDQWTASLTADADVSMNDIPLHFTINGVTYERKTNANGVAALNIRLLPGEYTATVQYRELNIPKATLTTVVVVVAADNDLVNDNSVGATLASGPYKRAVYMPDNLAPSKTLYYCSQDKNPNGDPLYDKNKIIIGVSWPNGFEISNNYLGLTLDIIPELIERKDTNLRETNENGELILPGGSLEVVISLNANGLIEDNNATYGKAYTISDDLINRKHNVVNIDIDDDIYAYGNIRSIGLRLKDTKDPKNTLICNKTEKDTYGADAIGLGLIRLTSYNIKPLVPYGNDVVLWKKIKKENLSNAYAEFKMNEVDVSTNRGVGYEYVAYYPLTHSSNLVKDSSGKIVDKTTTAITSSVATKHKTYYYNATMAYPNGITKSFKDISRHGSMSIKFDLRDGELGNLFKINTNFTSLQSYNLIRISYYLATDVDDSVQLTNNESTDTIDNNILTSGSIRKGDIYIDLYDTTDINNNIPVESLPLPAWGRTAQISTIDDKTVNAFFKIRSDAQSIKTIVLRRENPVGDEVKAMQLHLVDMVAYHTNVMPGLGPQILMRIYPNTLEDLNVPKIRKYGVIFKLQ